MNVKQSLYMALGSTPKFNFELPCSEDIYSEVYFYWVLNWGDLNLPRRCNGNSTETKSIRTLTLGLTISGRLCVRICCLCSFMCWMGMQKERKLETHLYCQWFAFIWKITPSTRHLDNGHCFWLRWAKEEASCIPKASHSRSPIWRMKSLWGLSSRRKGSAPQ